MEETKKMLGMWQGIASVLILQSTKENVQGVLRKAYASNQTASQGCTNDVRETT